MDNTKFEAIDKALKKLNPKWTNVFVGKEQKQYAIQLRKICKELLHNNMEPTNAEYHPHFDYLLRNGYILSANNNGITYYTITQKTVDRLEALTARDSNKS